jgi:acyl-CoA reductase-like NAD-dependent aldehyde dehydrogenase
MNDRFWINGEFCSALDGGTWPLVDPGSGEVVAELPFGGAADAERAIAAAERALPTWAATPPAQRAALLDQVADVIARHVQHFAQRTAVESGKPLAQALAEWTGAPAYLRTAAAHARALAPHTIALGKGRVAETRALPVGVVGVITAWNFPIYNPNRAVASALAAGCTVVLRPSEFTPRSAFDYAWAFAEAGLPAGVLNVLSGDPAAIGQLLLDDPRCRKISFTGSTRVGKLLMDGASRTVTRLSLELGGNAPVLVLPDVDVEAVAAGAVRTKLRNAGQVCISPQRFFVHARIADRFADAAEAAMRREVVGHALDPATTVGPLITARQRDRVADLVARSVTAGARLRLGGRAPDRPGWFYEPTLLLDVPPEAPVLREELFGPVLPVVAFDDLAAALAAANDTDYGLAAYVWTADAALAEQLADQLAFGLIGLNDWSPVGPDVPFGGVKQSGLGRESGLAGVHEYCELQTRFRPTLRDP